MALSLEAEVVALREQSAQLLGERTELRNENNHLKNQVQELIALVGQLRTTVEKQADHIAKLVKMTFGRKSERIEGPTLFDDVPDEPTLATPLTPIEPEPVVLVPKRKGHGRKRNSADLPRKREVLDLTDAEKVCPCCAAVRVRIGEDTRECLDYTPASIFVRQIARQKYACRSCEQAARGAQIAAKEFPAEVVPKSGVGAGLLAHALVSKYVDHLPLYRQESILARHGWDVSRTRLCDLLAASAKLLEPIYEAMIARVKLSLAIHADESPVRLLRPRRGAYAWLYRGDDANPFTVFDFTPGRSAEYPAAFLKGYAGWVHADGYTGYNALHGDGERHIGCWAHVRRKFVEARENNAAKASEALAFIRTLYAVEKEIVDRQLVSDNAVSLRQSRAGPVLRKFGDWLEVEYRTLLPKSSFGESVTYARNQWPTLGRYLSDARFQIDNNVAEREVRPLAVGRKNWLHIGGDGGLLSASVLMSVCASVKRRDLNPWLYLRDVLVRMATKPSDVTDLLPDAWAKRHLAAIA